MDEWSSRCSAKVVAKVIRLVGRRTDAQERRDVALAGYQEDAGRTTIVAIVDASQLWLENRRNRKLVEV